MKFWCLLLVPALAYAQQADAPKSQLGRVIGAVTVKDPSGKQLTVKSDAGADYTVALDEKTLYLRVPPGEKDLKKATKIASGDVKVGDRVMARGTVSEEQKSVPAVSVIVMTKEDLAQKQQREQAEWQTRGAAGVVKSVNAASGEIVVSSNARPGVSSLTTIVAGPNAKVRRYAQDSVRFADAKPAAIADIQPGDLLRSRGEKAADGTRLEAEDLVFGTFRTIAGTVISVDAASQELKLTDLETKKPVTIKLNANSQLKQLSPMVATLLARRLNPSYQAAAGGPGGPGGPAGFRPGAAGPGGPGAPAAAATQGHGAPGGTYHGGAIPDGAPASGGPAAAIHDSSRKAGTGAAPEAGAGDRPRMGMGGGGGGGIEQMLERLPAFTLADVKPGDPLIISTTARAGAPVANATTILAGVEPILRAAPTGSLNMGSWSLDLNMPAQ